VSNVVLPTESLKVGEPLRRVVQLATEIDRTLRPGGQLKFFDLTPEELGGEQGAAMQAFVDKLKGLGYKFVQQKSLGIDFTFRAIKPGKPIAGGALDIEIPTRARLQNPLAQPQLSGSPLVRSLYNDMRTAELLADDELVKMAELRAQVFRPALGKPKSRNDMLASRAVEGDVPIGALPEQVQGAVRAYQEMMADFAERLGLPQWKNYLTHRTNFNALYNTFREEFTTAENFRQLPLQLQLKVGSQEAFTSLKKVFDRNALWEQLPSVAKDKVKALWNMSDGVSEWNALPQFIKDKLPQEVFSPYLLPRYGKAPYEHSLLEAFDSYVPNVVHKIRFDPVVRRWSPIIDA
jgi:hypothetical protein